MAPGRKGKGFREKKKAGTSQASFITVALIALLIIAVSIRLIGIGKESVWLDEAITLRQAEQPMAITIHFVANDSHFPLYVILMHFWVRLFGISEIAARMLSLVFGVGSVYLIFLLGKRLFSPRVGLIAAAFLTFAPQMVYYSQEARLYTLFLFLTMLSCYFYVQLLEQQSKKNIALYIAATTLLIYTHMFAFLTLFCQAIHYLYINRRSTKRIAQWLIILAILFILFTPWLSVMVRQLGFSNLLAWIPKATGITFLVTAYTIMGGVPLLVIFLALCMIAFARWARAFSKAEQGNIAMLALFSALPIALVLIISAVIMPLFVPKFFIFLSGYLFIASSFLIERLVGARSIKIALVALVIISSLVSGISQYNTLDKQDWKGVALYIKEHREAGEPVIVEPYYYADPFAYQYDLSCFSTYLLNSCLFEKHNVLSLNYLAVCCNATTKVTATNSRDRLDDYTNGTLWVVMPSAEKYPNSDKLIAYIAREKKVEEQVTFTKDIIVYKFTG
jgi:mannosyltransferase